MQTLVRQSGAYQTQSSITKEKSERVDTGDKSLIFLNLFLVWSPVRF